MEAIEGDQIFDEDTIGEHAAAIPTEGGVFAGKLYDVEAPVNDETQKEWVTAHVSIHNDVLLKMNVDHLKDHLRMRGLKVTGNWSA